MKKFKIADFYIQLAIFAGIIVAIVISADVLFTLFAGYFIMGAYQLTSMLIHEFKQWFTVRGRARRYYHNATYAVVICMLLTPLVKFTGIIFFPFIYIAPIMAVYYTWLSYKETFVYLKRPLSVLR